jgi:glycosyltransferase involved in cell wall biosynthesis
MMTTEIHRPRVSVITPCYNAELFIERTLASVQSQTLCQWEQIVVDDGSQDGSAAIVKARTQVERRLRQIVQTNSGVCSARNAGYRASSPDTDYLLFLDADDCLEPQMLAEMVAYMDRHPDVSMVHCDHLLVDPQDRVVRGAARGLEWRPRYAPSRFGVKILQPEQVETPFTSIFTLAAIVPSLCLMRRSAYCKTPGWDEEFGQHLEDTDMFLKLALQGKVHFVDRPLVRYRKHPNQASGLTPQQRAVVDAAIFFREYRLQPYLGIRSASRFLCGGNIGDAARFSLGAVRRYTRGMVTVWFAGVRDRGHPALPA